MKASKLTKIINCLEQAVDSMEDGDANITPVKEMIVSYKELRKPLMEALEISAEASRGRYEHLDGALKLDYFASWEQNQTVVEQYHALIKSFTSFEYPCMELFPGTCQFIEQAVAAEPLYVADRSAYLLDNAASKFNQYYGSKRLMKYVIQGYDMTSLPQNSFGFIYAINWMRFESLSGLNNFAKSVYDCLMPGGVYLFSYVPIDQWWALEVAEYGYAAGADTVELKAALESIGFEILDHDSPSPERTYMLCKKSGEIEYIKGSSILAKIIDKPEDL